MARRAGEPFANHRTHRPPHEREFEGADDDRAAKQRTGYADERIFLAGLFLRLADAVAIPLAVAKFQRILGFKGARQLLLRFRVEKEIEAPARTNAHV